MSFMLTRRTFLQLMGASTGLAITGSEFLSQAAASAAPALSPHGSRGVEHVVVLMMANPSVPDLPVIGALAEHYTVLDRYFCSFAGETFPNRFYQHAARTDRDHNTTAISKLPAIWDMLSPIPNNQGIPTGGYFFRDLPFLALWGLKYFPFWHPFAAGDTDALGIPVTTLPFLDTVAQGLLPNVSFVDPAFDVEGKGTSADDHPLADIRLGERFIADAYHALANARYLDNTGLMITFDEWGGVFDHVPPPRGV